MTELETERLLLRRPTEADVASPPAFLSDPCVMHWLAGTEPPAEVVRRWLEEWERFPTGKLIVERRSDGALVGRVGANYCSRRVAERLGARPQETVELPGLGPHVVWVHPR